MKKALFQHLNMPDDTWNPKGLDIPLRRPVEIFVPNVCAIDMDTTGTWPFGRRLEDQVATRFLSMFLDMNAEFNGKKYHVEIAERPGGVGRAADRAEDAAEPAEERQGVSQGLSLSGGAVVTAKTDYQSDLSGSRRASPNCGIMRSSRPPTPKR